jgi:hypothetical protein
MFHAAGARIRERIQPCDTTKRPRKKQPKSRIGLNGMFRQFGNGWREPDGASGCSGPDAGSLQRSLQSSARHLVPIADRPRSSDVKFSLADAVRLPRIGCDRENPSGFRSEVLRAGCQKPPHRRDNGALSGSRGRRSPATAKVNPRLRRPISRRSQRHGRRKNQTGYSQ